MSIQWLEIRDRLMASSSSLRFKRDFDALRSQQVFLNPFSDPVALLDALRHGQSAPEEKNRWLRSLIGAAQLSGRAADCAMTLLFLALWPGLDRVRRKLQWRYAASAHDVVSDILVHATAAFRTLDLQQVNWIAATILRNIERDIGRELQKNAAHQCTLSDTDPDEIAIVPVCTDAQLRAGRLHAEIERLLAADATLVIRVAVQGFTRSEAAIELGISEAAARKRLQRATRRLRASLPNFFEPLSHSGRSGGF